MGQASWKSLPPPLSPFPLTDTPLFISVVYLCHNHAIPVYSLVLKNDWQYQLVEWKIIPSCVSWPVHMRAASILLHTRVKCNITQVTTITVLQNKLSAVRDDSLFKLTLCCLLKATTVTPYLFKQKQLHYIAWNQFMI